MSGSKLAAILLIVAGILGLAHGGFTYTKETHSANIGPLQLQVQEKERVDIPLWAGVAAVAGGLVLLTMGRRT